MLRQLSQERGGEAVKARMLNHSHQRAGVSKNAVQAQETAFRNNEGETTMAVLGEYEPLGTREGLLIGAIGAAFSPADTVSLNNRETTACGGVAITDQFINRVDLRQTMLLLVRQSMLTQREYLVLWLRFAKGKTQEGAARHIHITRETVGIDERAALQTLVRYIWGEPDYQTPPRIRRLRQEQPA